MKPSMQGGQQDSVVRLKSLESRAQGKLAHAVRGGADGKGPRKRDLAGGLLHFEGGGLLDMEFLAKDFFQESRPGG